MVSILFTITGPYGTFEAGDFYDRILYWSVLTGVSAMLAIVLKSIRLRYLDRFGLLGGEGLSILTLIALFTPFLLVWTSAAFPGSAAQVPSFWLMETEVLVICVAISAIIYGLPGAARQNAMTEQMHTQTRLARRLPAGFEGQILHLSVKGHKVQVFTCNGMYELRMRFSDAIEEVSELKGFCTHRSHWVTAAAISDVKFKCGRPVLVLNNGEKIPVSRNYQNNVIEAGFLKAS